MDSLINFFVGSGFRGSGLELVRARAFILTVTLIILIFLLNIVLYSFTPAQSAYSFRLNLLINSAFAMIYFSSAMTIRFTGNLTLASNFVTFWTTLILTSLCYLTGGAVDSSIAWLLWVPLAMAFLFSGYRTGLFWSVVILAAYSAMLVAELQGHRFPQIIESERMLIGTVTSWYSGFFAMLILCGFVPYMTYSLIQVRGGKLSPLHMHLEREGPETEVPLSLLESYIFQTVHRHAKFEDRFLLLNISLEIGSDDPNIAQAIRKEIFQRLHQFVRRTDLVMNLDNGTIAILFENLTSSTSAIIIQNALTQQFYQPFSAGGGMVKVSPMIQAKLFPDEEADADEFNKVLRRFQRKAA